MKAYNIFANQTAPKIHFHQNNVGDLDDDAAKSTYLH